MRRSLNVRCHLFRSVCVGVSYILLCCLRITVTKKKFAPGIPCVLSFTIFPRKNHTRPTYFAKVIPLFSNHQRYRILSIKVWQLTSDETNLDEIEYRTKLYAINVRPKDESYAPGGISFVQVCQSCTPSPGSPSFPRVPLFWWSVVQRTRNTILQCNHRLSQMKTVRPKIILSFY